MAAGWCPLAPVSVIAPGRPGGSDDEGGPGDTPVSVRWLRSQTGHGGSPSRTRGSEEVHPALMRPPRRLDRDEARGEREADDYRPPALKWCQSRWLAKARRGEWHCHLKR